MLSLSIKYMFSFGSQISFYQPLTPHPQPEKQKPHQLFNKMQTIQKDLYSKCHNSLG